jgi:hypothetical protein
LKGQGFSSAINEAHKFNPYCERARLQSCRKPPLRRRFRSAEGRREGAAATTWIDASSHSLACAEEGDAENLMT